jgi:hypothetical protein
MAYVYKSAAVGTGGEIGKAVPTTQRAALVREGAAWSLILEPKYDRPKAGVAWLVPFAHCPTVSAADPKVLAELGLVTAPLFLEVCLQTCMCSDQSASCLPDLFGGGSTSGGMDDGETSVATNGQRPLDVDIWQSGSIGNLDFVVISAENPADIPEWLDRGGYDNPPELADFVTGRGSDYGCYFAARLGVPAGEHDVFPAVRFALDSRDPPSYPLRLTKLGVAEGRTLGVTLYVVNPADRGAGATTTNVVLDGFDAAVPACAATSAGAYQACVDQALAANPSALAVTFHDGLASRRAAFLGNRRLCKAYGADNFFAQEQDWCVETAAAFTGIPTTWTPDVQGWLAGEARITRYEARLPPAAMDRDLVFRVGRGASAGSCTSDGHCPGWGWSWEPTTCTTSDGTGACIKVCESAETCPLGWTCDDIDTYWKGCMPPVVAAIAGDEMQDPLPDHDALAVTITSGCGLDCDDVCYGGATATVAPDFGGPGTPGTPRTGIHTLPALAILAAAQLFLAAWLRRRGGRVCAS